MLPDHNQFTYSIQRQTFYKHFMGVIVTLVELNLTTDKGRILTRIKLLCWCLRVGPNDLSAFAMPLMDSDYTEGAGAMEDDFRQRSGSGGIKSLFGTKPRQRNKSGDELKGDKNSSPTSGSKMKNFFESIRPRSKSDVSGMKKPGKKAAAAAQNMDRSMDESTLAPQLNSHGAVNSSVSQGATSHGAAAVTPVPKGPSKTLTPMSEILEGQMYNFGDKMTERNRHKSGPATPVEQFMSKFRNRSNSDSKPKKPTPTSPHEKTLSPPSSPKPHLDVSGDHSTLVKHRRRDFRNEVNDSGIHIHVYIKVIHRPTHAMSAF
ncbi:hypothetical protein LOTGIDRAFT_166040 [Lottia gigantea]|uniref:Uncharacterized protein n=1 Tax=Lottia gigantea TaxID=225164 RepID=V4BHF7_LOTGI|nr:hypothetical protein LOTGIDRAFT_166040 [Lottia gigantea]ESO88019.1 hypothetical protein LOTGIDRAFT_166040 [Lottia gigantea]